MTRVVTYVEIDVPTFISTSPETVETFRFAIPSTYLSQDIDAIPIIDSVSFTPARISLGKDLGQRAELEITFDDCRYIFNGESFEQGTFWGKWRGRYGTKLRGRALRLIRGVVGQAIEDMDTRHYIIDTTDGPTFDGKYTIAAKDLLKFADNDRAQAPAVSTGSLAGSIDDVTTSLTASPTGIGDAEYPASGWVCLGGSEVVSFTRSGDVFTITRAQLGTVAQSHDAGDRVQLVKRFTGNTVADIINDLLTNYAGVDSAYIPLTDWETEAATYLGVIYARTITDPTSVNELISELIAQAALALWWDDRAKMIRLNVLREISTNAATFGDQQILENSFRVQEQPDKRISQLWTFYGQKNPTDSAGKKENFRAVEIDEDLGREAEYGSPEIFITTGKWLETQSSAQRLNAIQLSRFRDPPRRLGFDLFRDQAITPAAGYKVQYWGSQDETGQAVDILIQVTQVTIYPDRIHVEAEEMLASGAVVLTNVVFLQATDGSVEEWAVPETWNDADNSIDTIGAGAGGARATSSGGKGGGSGAYSRITNLALAASPPGTVQYSVGVHGRGGNSNGNPSSTGEDGGNTWFDGATFGAASVAAEGANGGSGRTGAGEGGLAANGTGATKTSGGEGGNGATKGETRAGGGGGAGAGGPNGDGADGANNGGDNDDAGAGGSGADGGSTGSQASGTTPGDGGDNRFNFGGGDATTPAGQEGGGGRGGERNEDGHPGGAGEQLWTQTIAPIISAGPGGGGGGGGDNNSGGPGGDYGAGGGGSGEDGNGGDGSDGIIVITWREAA